MKTHHITIKTFFYLLKLHYNNFKVDLQKYNKVKSLSCKIHFTDEAKVSSILISPAERAKLHEIRKFKH